MLKKYLLTASFLCAAVVLTGCNADKQAAEQEQVNYKYILTKTLPTENASYVKDKETGFVKINPHFNTANFPSTPEGAPEWVKDGLGAKLPAFPHGTTVEVINTDNQFVAYIANTVSEDFDKYYGMLAAEGFKFPKNDTWESFNMTRDDIVVNLRFCQDGENIITVRAKLNNAPKEESKKEEAKK